MPFTQYIEARAFERYRVIIVEIIDADHGMTLRHEPVGDVHPDKPCRAGDQNRHALLPPTG